MSDTFLFITKPGFTPERVEKNEISWSCSKTTEAEDSILVYLVKTGIAYVWRATSNAEPDPKWGHACNVKHVCTFKPPISIAELRAAFATNEWKALNRNFQGFRSIKIPIEAVRKIIALRPQAPPRKSREMK